VAEREVPDVDTTEQRARVACGPRKPA